jgi:hypothetical protein
MSKSCFALSLYFVSKEVAMDFIERWFGISPDGGNGTLEGLYISVLLLTVVLVSIRFRRHLAELFKGYLERLGKHKSGDRFDS